MIYNLTEITEEDIKNATKEAIETPIIARQSDIEQISDILYALHIGKGVIADDKDGG